MSTRDIARRFIQAHVELTRLLRAELERSKQQHRLIEEQLHEAYHAFTESRTPDVLQALSRACDAEMELSGDTSVTSTLTIALGLDRKSGSKLDRKPE